MWCPAEVDTPIVRGTDGSGIASFGDGCRRCRLRQRGTTAAAGRADRHRPPRGPGYNKPRPTRPDWQAAYWATGPKVERKIGHLTRRVDGGRKSPMSRCSPSLIDFITRAAAINLARLATVGLHHDTTGWTSPAMPYARRRTPDLQNEPQTPRTGILDSTLELPTLRERRNRRTRESDDHRPESRNPPARHPFSNHLETSAITWKLQQSPRMRSHEPQESLRSADCLVLTRCSRTGARRSGVLCIYQEGIRCSRFHQETNLGSGEETDSDCVGSSQ